MPETMPPSLLDREVVLSCLPAQAAELLGELDVQTVIDSTNVEAAPGLDTDAGNSWRRSQFEAAILILQMDVGNTRAKWRLCRGEELIESGVLDRQSANILPALAQQPAELWISSVAGAKFETVAREQAQHLWNIEPWFARSSAAACGLVNSYDEPQRMGVDRWLAMIAAWSQLDAKSGYGVCVVDAGSALTIDFVAVNGKHLGGYILPGLDSMEKALLQDTDRVRFSEAPRDSIAPGRSTEQAVYNGLLLSQAGAIALAMSRQAEKFSLVFSGGSGLAIQEVLGLGGRFDADMVMDGLALLAASCREERAGLA